MKNDLHDVMGIDGGPGIDPPTNVERLPAKAQAIYHDAEDAYDAHQAAYDAKLAKDTAINAEIGELQASIARAGRAQKPNAAFIANAESKIAKLKERKATLQAKHAARPGSPFTSLYEFVRRNRGPWREVVVTDEALPGAGLADMVDHYRNEAAKCRADQLIVERKPVSRDLMESAIARAVDKVARKPNPAAVRRMRRDGRHFAQGSVEWPMSGRFNGVGIRDEPDLAATLVFLFRDEIVSKLSAMALNDYAPGEALGEAERRAKLAALEAEQLRLERLGEHWYQRCREAGIAAQRYSVNPLVILGIEPA